MPHPTGPRPESTWGSDHHAQPHPNELGPGLVAAGGVRDLGGGRAGWAPSSDASHLRAQGPGRPGGSRRYSDDDIEQLRRIQELTQEGLNLAGVQRVLELEAELADLRRRLEEVKAGAEAAVEQTHRQYRRDLVPLSQSVVLFRRR